VLITEDEFMADVAIDPDQLDELWMIQPQVFEKYSQNYAEVMMKRDNFKIEVDALKSKKMKEIMDDPTKFGVKKTTGEIMSALLMEQDDYVAKLKEYNQINHDYNVAKDRKEAVRQKKDSLENMVKLFGQTYFSGPLVPKKLESGERYISKKSSEDSVKTRREYNLKRRK